MGEVFDAKIRFLQALNVRFAPEATAVRIGRHDPLDHWSFDQAAEIIVSTYESEQETVYFHKRARQPVQGPRAVRGGDAGLAASIWWSYLVVLSGGRTALV